jgi:Flp pilus assembly protein TadD
MTAPRRLLRSLLPASVAAAGLAACLCAGCGRDQSKPLKLHDTSAANMPPIDGPPNTGTLYAMTKVLAGQGRDEQCIYVLQAIIRQSPRFAPAYCDLAELYMKTGRVDAAIKTLDDGLTACPSEAVLANDLGMCRVFQGDYGEALRRFTQAAGISPGDSRYRANAAMALGMMGRYDEALALLRQVVPESEAHHNLAVIARARGDRKFMAEEFARAEALTHGDAAQADKPAGAGEQAGS